MGLDNCRYSTSCAVVFPWWGDRAVLFLRLFNMRCNVLLSGMQKLKRKAMFLHSPGAADAMDMYGCFAGQLHIHVGSAGMPRPRAATSMASSTLQLSAAAE